MEFESHRLAPRGLISPLSLLRHVEGETAVGKHPPLLPNPSPADAHGSGAQGPAPGHRGQRAPSTTSEASTPSPRLNSTRGRYQIMIWSGCRTGCRRRRPRPARRLDSPARRGGRRRERRLVHVEPRRDQVEAERRGPARGALLIASGPDAIDAQNRLMLPPGMLPHTTASKPTDCWSRPSFSRQNRRRAGAQDLHCSVRGGVGMNRSRSDEAVGREVARGQPYQFQLLSCTRPRCSCLPTKRFVPL